MQSLFLRRRRSNRPPACNVSPPINKEKRRGEHLLARNGPGKKEEEGIREIARGGRKEEESPLLKGHFRPFLPPPLPFFLMSALFRLPRKKGANRRRFRGADRSKNWVFLRENGLLCRIFFVCSLLVPCNIYLAFLPSKATIFCSSSRHSTQKGCPRLSSYSPRRKLAPTPLGFEISLLLLVWPRILLTFVRPFMGGGGKIQLEEPKG